jgi:hypothetical protein
MHYNGDKMRLNRRQLRSLLMTEALALTEKSVASYMGFDDIDTSDTKARKEVMAALTALTAIPPFVVAATILAAYAGSSEVRGYVNGAIDSTGETVEAFFDEYLEAIGDWVKQQSIDYAGFLD